MRCGRYVAISRTCVTSSSSPLIQEPCSQADMKRQRLKLMDMIAALVGSLDQRELFGRCTGKELPREFNRLDSSNERHGGIAVRACYHPPRAEETRYRPGLTDSRC